MVLPKLTVQDCKKIAELLEQGHSARDLAERYDVHRSVIYRRIKHHYLGRYIPVEKKNKVIKAIKEGYTKAEAAQMYNLPVSSVRYFTKGLHSTGYEGNHILRRNGIELLRRLMQDGCLINDFIVSTARRLQQHFPMIQSARYKDKTFFYLQGREEETIEAYFKLKPDRVINYRAVEELAYLLDVEISNKERHNLVERFKGKHDQYWQSRRLIQRSLLDFTDDYEQVESGFKLMPKNEDLKEKVI